MECAQLAAAFVSAPEFDRGGSAALCSLRRLRPVLWLRLRRAVYFAVCPAPDSSGSTSRQLRIAPDSSGQHDQESGPTRAYPDLSGPIRQKNIFPAKIPVKFGQQTVKFWTHHFPPLHHPNSPPSHTAAPLITCELLAWLPQARVLRAASGRREAASCRTEIAWDYFGGCQIHSCRR